MKSKLIILGIFGFWLALILGSFVRHSLTYDPFFGTSRNLIFRHQVRGPILDRYGEILAAGSGSSRYYPLGPAGSPIIGVARPGFGVEGFIEQKFAERLISNRKSKFWYLLNQRDEGCSLKTTLDKKLQQKAYQAMGGNKGAMVIMKLNGEVLVSLSLPSFDPNKSKLTYSKSKTASQDLFLNKAFDGRFEPGSAWKTVIGLALLENKYRDNPVTCTGSLTVGRKAIRCLGRHGVVKTLGEALVVSCNVWFMKTVLTELDTVQLKEVFQKFMARKMKKELSDEDLAMAAIGQGEILVSPFELCQLAATIGNKGLKPEPRLVKEKIKSEKVIDEKTALSLLEMMTVVVKKGTARGLSEFLGKGTLMAAKTGTAERDTPRGKVNSAVLIGLAGRSPKKAELAFSIIVEETAGYGGTVCVPILKEVLAHYFSKPKELK